MVGIADGVELSREEDERTDRKKSFYTISYANFLCVCKNEPPTLNSIFLVFLVRRPARYVTRNPNPKLL